MSHDLKLKRAIVTYSYLRVGHVYFIIIHVESKLVICVEK